MGSIWKFGGWVAATLLLLGSLAVLAASSVQCHGRQYDIWRNPKGMLMPAHGQLSFFIRLCTSGVVHGK
jgi:hypothetical protein